MNMDWREYAHNLAQLLISKGKLSDLHWSAAVRSVPRHVLVPEYYRLDEYGQLQHVPPDDADLAEMYTNTAFFTNANGTSSTSQPGLMTRMLELLKISETDRVLEIGTGTGYNAALLCHRLGDENVFSVDIEFVEDARSRLARLGYFPTLITADGLLGLPEHAPYDRIIATCAVPRIPFAWVEQLQPGGAALADLKVGNTAGNLVLLHKEGDIARGRFDSGYAAFMSARRPGETPTTRPPVSETTARVRGTTAWPFCWEHQVPWFLAQFQLPAGTRYGLEFDADTGERSASRLYAPDGSKALVQFGADGEHTVTETGPTPLWHAVERAERRWRELDQPEWQRFELVVTPDEQIISLDGAPGPSWRLP